MRSKLDVFAEVLETARSGTTKTSMISHVNLNQRSVKDVLNLLVNLDLLAVNRNSPISYGTTEKGIRFLREYHHLQTLLSSKFGLQEKL